MTIETNWYHEGVMDFNDGLPRIMPKCLFLHDNWQEKARQWYAGWDWANINNPLAELEDL